jgi:hypothetical protein
MDNVQKDAITDYEAPSSKPFRLHYHTFLTKLPLGQFMVTMYSTWNFLVGFQVLTVASMKMAVFWVVAPCSLVDVYQRF